MIIEAINVFEWIPSTQWTASVKSGTGLNQEPWVNSKFDILFGSADSWNIGLGRNTHVFGPDLKVIADWTYLESKIGGLFPRPGPKVTGVLFGSGGATDFIMGDKTLLNYWGMNFLAERKSSVSVDAKYPVSKEGFTKMPWSLWAGVILGFTALLGAIIAARIVYMTSGDPKNLATKILKSVVPFIETRWVAVIIGYEKLAWAAKSAKEKADKETKETAVDLRKKASALASMPAFTQIIIAHSSIADRLITVRMNEVAAGVVQNTVNLNNTIQFVGDIKTLAGSIV